MNLRRLSPVLCLAAALTLAGGARADDGRPPGRSGSEPAPRGLDAPGRADMRRPAALPRMAPPPRGGRQDALSDSVRRVQSRTGGQVLSAERVPFDGRDISRVKVVDQDGRVRVYMDDPTSRRAPRPTRSNDD